MGLHSPTCGPVPVGWHVGLGSHQLGGVKGDTSPSPDVAVWVVSPFPEGSSSLCSRLCSAWTEPGLFLVLIRVQ